MVGDLYTPANMKNGYKLRALAVVGSYGAVKEQLSGRYAQGMAARGFIALAIDPAFTDKVAESLETFPPQNLIQKIF